MTFAPSRPLPLGRRVLAAFLAGLAAAVAAHVVVVFVFYVLQATGLAWLGIVMAVETPYVEMLPAFILAGIGMGLVFAPLSTAVLATMRHDDHAKASGTNSTLREIGVALGIAVLTAVFVGAGGQLTPTGYVDAAVPAVLVGAAVLALSAVIALALPLGRAVRASGAPESTSPSI